MADTPERLSSVILAGGRSRRMGQDKALMKLPSGQSLLSQTVEVAGAIAPHISIVTPWPERYQGALAQPLPQRIALPVQPAIQWPAIQWIEDIQAAGPLTGFAQAWPQIQSDWCLLLACDLPNLDAQILQQWWRWLSSEINPARAASTSRLQASLIKGEKGWEPLCGYYHRSCLSSLNQHLDSGALDFQSWLPTLKIATYAAVPEGMLFNCNRPLDWTQLQADE